jgi:multidrug efflux pump subunit AcrB
MRLQITKEIEKTPTELDLEYLKTSLEYENNQLKHLHYNIKEIKACMDTAIAEENTERIPVLRQQKSQINEMIKAANVDVKRISSIYKFYVRSLKKNG